MTTIGWAPERWDGLIEAGWDPEEYELLYDDCNISSVGEALMRSFPIASDGWNIVPNPLSREQYAEYLRGDHWRATRKRALIRAGRKCHRCLASNMRLDVHHLTYVRVGKEAEADLMVLCATCHAFEHGIPTPGAP